MAAREIFRELELSDDFENVTNIAEMIVNNDITTIDEFIEDIAEYWGYKDFICYVMGEYTENWQDNKLKLSINFLKELLIYALEDEEMTLIYIPIADILDKCFS